MRITKLGHTSLEKNEFSDLLNDESVVIIMTLKQYLINTL